MPSLGFTAGAWAWDRYGESVTRKAAASVKARWKKFRWKAAAEEYRAKIKRLYGTMQIMGMPEPVPLEDIFTEAYLLDKPTAFGRFDIERLKQTSADPDSPPPNAKRIGGLTLVSENKNLFILGKPGAGKSTFLKYIALQAAESIKPIIDKIPVFISLKEWSDSGKDLMPFIAERFDICNFPDAEPFVEELLKSDSAVVLFDGLDEVNQESGERDKQTRVMNNFVEKYDRTQTLITCRIAASDYSFQPFTYVEIADFTEAQIRTFVGNWFRNQEGEKDEDTSKRFQVEFKKTDNKGLQDLARTPLLLTLLCLTFDETLTFPQRRAEIYQEALDALLKKWDASRRIKRDEVYRKLSLGHKENMLARIAAETFEKNEYFIPQADLESYITNYVKNVPPHDTDEAADGEVILKSIEAQHGIFVERARKIYSFSHLTFQEYFAARYIVENAGNGTLDNLIDEHCADQRWREVFLLTTSLLPDAKPFINAFRCRVDRWLREEKKLNGLLGWADRKSSSIGVTPWLIRPNWLFVEFYWRPPSDILRFALTVACKPALDLAHNLGLARNSGFRLDPWIIPDHIFTHDFAFALVLACSLSHVEERTRDRDLDRALDFTLPLARERARVRARDIVNAHSRELALTRDLAHQLGSKQFAAELAALSIPTVEATPRGWKEFASNLRGLMAKHRDIGHEWDLTEAQEGRLADYLNATRLLQDCLELAFMPANEKEDILHSLYLPPADSDASHSPHS
jgi:energy-coupling factor transporter ATP-binding protein EcfA2